MPSDLALFVGQILRSPKTISAMAPSSRGLARAITAEIGPDTGPVAEFGPGTGVFTRMLLERGVAPKDLTLFEVNPTFAATLRTRFPGVRVINGGAQDIGLHCASVGAVVSGLPLLSFPDTLIRAILGGAFSTLRPGAAMYQFTYGPRSPVPDAIAKDLGVDASPASGRVWLNWPPARVYRLTRSADQSTD
jgi:phosphatidylethanolamine/phosphatidyl-N-methylethanolamine N-methyltransferase